MIFNKKYVNDNQIMHILHFTFYNGGVEFLNDLISDVMNLYKKDLIISKDVVLDIIKFGIQSNKIIVKAPQEKVYDKKNYNELIVLIISNFDKFLDLTNGDFPYHYGIYYTDSWKKELSKIGLWKE